LRNTARDESYVTKAPLELCVGFIGRQICAIEHGRGLASHRKVTLSTLPLCICSRPSGCPACLRRTSIDSTTSASALPGDRHGGASDPADLACRWGLRAGGSRLLPSSGIVHASTSRQVTQAARKTETVQVPDIRSGVHVSSESLKFNGIRKSWFRE
jgi:hypothetical protein